MYFGPVCSFIVVEARIIGMLLMFFPNVNDAVIDEETVIMSGLQCSHDCTPAIITVSFF